MKNVLLVIYKFIRGIFRFFFLLFGGLFCQLIYIVTKEEGKDKKITVRKAKRIRFFTKLKLNALKYLPHLMKFLGEYKYLEFLNKKLNYGL